MLPGRIIVDNDLATVTSIRSWAIAMLLLGLAVNSACTSFDSKLDSWVGSRIDKLLSITGKGREELLGIRGPDSRGHRQYVYKVCDHCTVLWDVNAQGVITGWTREGWGCKHYWQ